MLQKEYLSKAQIDKVKPHFQEFFVKQFKKAKEEIKEGEVFQQHMEDYLSTEKYDELLDSINGNGDAIEQISLLVETYIDIAYNDKEEFNTFVHRVLNSTIINRTYNLSVYSEEVFNKENCSELVASVVDNAICKKIEDAQKKYATDKLNIRTNMYSFSTPKILDAVLATTQCGSIDEIEQSILNNIDFEAVALSKV